MASITFLTHDRLKCASTMCQLLGKSLSGGQNPSQIFPWGRGQVGESALSGELIKLYLGGMGARDSPPN